MASKSNYAFLLHLALNFRLCTLKNAPASRGRFIIRTQGGCVLYACTKFEADSSIRSKLIRVSKFGNWVT